MIPLRLELGSGKYVRPGWTNVDLRPSTPDVVEADLTKYPWPWKDNSVDEIHASHLFEHLPFKETLEECHRVLKLGGRLHIEVPHANTYPHCVNPTHRTIFSWQTFDPWDKDFFFNNHQDTSDYGIKMFWKMEWRHINFMCDHGGFLRKIFSFLPDLFINAFPVIYERFFMYIFQSVNIQFKLTKLNISERKS